MYIIYLNRSNLQNGNIQYILKFVVKELKFTGQPLSHILINFV